MIQHQVNSGVLEIHINRPERKNALNLEMYRELTRLLTKVGPESKVRSVLITGTEDCFTSGNDLNDFVEASDFTDSENPILRFMQALTACRQPVIAAVQGVAVESVPHYCCIQILTMRRHQQYFSYPLLT